MKRIAKQVESAHLFSPQFLPLLPITHIIVNSFVEMILSEQGGHRRPL